MTCIRYQQILKKKKHAHTKYKAKSFPTRSFHTCANLQPAEAVTGFSPLMVRMCCSMAWVQRERVAKCVWLLLAYMLVLEQLTMCIYIIHTNISTYSIYVNMCIYIYIFIYVFINMFMIGLSQAQACIRSILEFCSGQMQARSISWTHTRSSVTWQLIISNKVFLISTPQASLFVCSVVSLWCYYICGAYMELRW